MAVIHEGAAVHHKIGVKRQSEQTRFAGEVHARADVEKILRRWNRLIVVKGANEPCLLDDEPA